MSRSGELSHLNREDAMLTKHAALGVAAVAAFVAATPAMTGVFNAPDREAPRIMLDPAADNTDPFAFTAQDAPGKLTVVANWVPLENPAGGPYFG
jgi:hypothetical protein